MAVGIPPQRSPDEYVASRSCYDPEIKEWFPFPSHSDALIAQLYLQYDCTPSAINRLLDILRSGSFSIEDVTLKNALEIDDIVARCRLKMARKRSQKVSNSPVPPLVVDLVADCIVVGDLDFDWASRTRRSPTREEIKTLKHMSLTHRSWTEPAQRILRRHLWISRKALQGGIRNPLCGPWTQNLTFRFSLPRQKTTLVNELKCQDVVTYFTGLLRRAPNTKCLYLSKLQQPFLDTLGLTCYMQSLGSFVVSMIFREVADLEKLFTAISDLKQLRQLNLDLTRSSISVHADVVSDDLGGLCPPSSLKEIVCSADEVPVPYAAWILASRNGFIPKALSLSEKSREFAIGLVPEIVSTLHCLEHLTLRPWTNVELVLIEFLKHCKCLRSLSVYHLRTLIAVGKTMKGSDVLRSL